MPLITALSEILRLGFQCNELLENTAWFDFRLQSEGGPELNHAQFSGVQVCSNKADTVNILGELVRIVRHCGDRIFAILLEKFDGVGSGNQSTITFDWDSPVNITSVGLLDVEAVGGFIEVFGEDDTSLGRFSTSKATQNGGSALMGD